MLGLRRGRKEREEARRAGSTISADLSGAVITGSQVAVGENITQLYAEAGSVLNYVAPKEQPRPRLRPLPILRLPRDFPMLLGRREQVEASRTALAAGSPVEFFGEPGIGKSVLLRHLAHHSGERPSEGTIHHGAAGEPLEDSLQFVFESFYECETVFVPTPGQLRGYLGERRALLIFDDLGLERDELDRLLDAMPGCPLLTASATRQLWGEGEAIELGGLGEEDALALVEAELRRPLSSKDDEAVRSLCRSLRGHPLRLLQAAGEIRGGRSAVQLADTAAAGPAALEASLVNSLTEEKLALLRALSSLPAGSLHRDDLADVTGVSNIHEQLEALEQQGLVQSHSPRYTVAANLRGELLDESQQRRWRERLLERFVSCGEELRNRADGPAALVLLEWAANTRREDSALRLARVLDRSFSLTGRWGSWRRTLDVALRAARKLGDRATEAWSLHQIGSRALCLGDRAAAKESLTAALGLREALGDRQGAAITRHNLNLLSPGPPSFARNGHRWLSWPLILILGLLAAAAAVAIPLLVTGGSNRPSPSAGNQAVPATGGPSPTGQPGTTPPGTTPPPNQTERPNLIVTDMRADASCEVAYSLQNAGAADAGPSTTAVTVVDDDGTSHTATEPEQSLGAGTAREGKATALAGERCPLPINVTVEADSGVQVPESDETDNSSTEEFGPTQEATPTPTPSSSTTITTTSTTATTTTTSTSTTSDSSAPK